MDAQQYDKKYLRKKYGAGAEDMKEKMLCYMKENRKDINQQRIAHLIEKNHLKLTTTSLNRYHLCDHCAFGGGSWSYNFETSKQKLPLQLVYFYASPSSSSSHEGPEEDVHVFYFNKKKEIENEMQDAIVPLLTNDI